MVHTELATYSAALAFYAIYALAPMLIIFISIAGFLVGEEVAQERILFYFEQRVGEGAVPFFENVILAVNQSEAHVLFSFLGIFIMIYGLVHFFSTLKEALFSIFGVRFDMTSNLPKNFLNFIKSAGYTLALLVLILILISLNALAPLVLNFPGYLSFLVFLSGFPFIDLILAFLLTVAILTFSYGFVSSFNIKWRSALVGAFSAAFLLLFLNVLLALYFSLFKGVHAIYGASSSLVAFLLWVYYSTRILLIGAFTAEITNQNIKD